MKSKEKTLKDLYEGLKRHYGAINEVAKRMKEIREAEGKDGYHRNWVRLVLKGEFEDIELVEVAAKVLHEYETSASARMERIERMVAEATQLATA